MYLDGTPFTKKKKKVYCCRYNLMSVAKNVIPGPLDCCNGTIT